MDLERSSPGKKKKKKEGVTSYYWLQTRQPEAGEAQNLRRSGKPKPTVADTAHLHAESPGIGTTLSHLRGLPLAQTKGLGMWNKMSVRELRFFLTPNSLQC